MKFNWKCNFLMLALVALASTPAFTQIVVNTVPFDPTNPSAPHTSYAGATIVLGATVNLPNSTDTFTFQWNYGDGSLLGPSATVAHAAGCLLDTTFPTLTPMRARLARQPHVRPPSR